MSDSGFRIRSAQALLRRRSRVLVVVALVGLLLGIAFVAYVPPRLTSTALVLLPTPTTTETSTGERDINTQVRIALSTVVLAAAGQEVTPRLTFEEVKDRIRVDAPTNQLVRIRAFSPDGGRARALAQAVAEAYVGFVREADRRVTEAALADLTDRETDLSKQVKALQDEIDATVARKRTVSADSPDGRREGQLLARLRAEQAHLSLQLDKVKASIATNTPATSAAGAVGTTVLQDADSAVGPPLWQRLLIWPPIGALTGVALAAAVLVLASRRDPRMALRDEIADAVGSPVLAGTRSHPQRSVAGWRALLGTYEVSPVESWAFRQVLRALAVAEAGERGAEPRARVEYPRSVSVVTLAGDTRALALGPQLAVFAASLGIRTRLMTGPGHDRTAALWAAVAGGEGSHPRSRLTLGDGESDEHVDLTVCLVVVDRRWPTLSEAPATTTTALAVGSAAATQHQLARVAVAVDDAGRRIDGVVVADPDRADRTTGRHTLDERTRHAPLPVRLTGGTASDAAPDRQGGR